MSAFFYFSRKIQDKIGNRWMFGQLLLMVIVFSFYFIGLSMLEIPYTLVLALFGALLEMVPYAGPTMAAIPAALLRISGVAVAGDSGYHSLCRDSTSAESYRRAAAGDATHRRIESCGSYLGAAYRRESCRYRQYTPLQYLRRRRRCLDEFLGKKKQNG